MPNRPVIMVPNYEGNGAVLLARLEDSDGTVLTQAEISSITAKSYEKGDRGNPIIEQTLTVASVVFNTAQAWPTREGFTAPDSTGYNFWFDCPGTYFPQGNREYVVEIKVLGTDGYSRYQTWEQPTLDLNQR